MISFNQGTLYVVLNNTKVYLVLYKYTETKKYAHKVCIIQFLFLLILYTCFLK
jgi:hypothetical protein